MSENDEAQKFYLAGYTAFEAGDYESARALADTCLEISLPSSYWYAGSLGLKCWVANFSDNRIELEQAANTLLAIESGSDKPWFDAVALLNLGLSERKAGCKREAQQFLWRAAELYAEQQLQPEQPQEWQKVLDYFSTLSRWAATGERDEWINLLTQFETYADEQSELIQQLSEVARIMLDYTMGEDVRQASVDLVEQGISRTFLSAILLEQSG
jgi:tetratricopeptide (TPR) repeat protein